MPNNPDNSRAEVRGPSGDTYEVLRRGGPIRLRPAPRISAEAGGNPLVVKDDKVFACSRLDGDIGVATAEGFYSDDTRYLSGLRMRIGGKSPLLLSCSADSAYQAFIDLTNPELGKDGSRVPQMTLNIRRVRLVHDQVYEAIEIRNHSRQTIESELQIDLAADFADMFEVRGVSTRLSRGQILSIKRSNGGLVFGYLGEDELLRQTFVDLDPTPEIDINGEKAFLRWPFRLGPRNSLSVAISFEPSLNGERSPNRSVDDALKAAEQAAEVWRDSSTEIKGLHTSFNRVVEASVRDLRALTTEIDDRRMMTAGIPWFVAPFGRDALITCYETLLLNPELSRDTLRFLSARQATTDDPERDAEPGKILHELRTGELARAGYIPHTPYYGSVDSTPLFVALAAAYYRWTADLETLSELLPSIDAALSWMDNYGDRDGDGFLEYERRSSAGLSSQGWKDSEDAIMHADGSIARPPIALVEVQGYAYIAKERIADVYEVLGHSDRAAALRKEAKQLKDAFNDAYWMPNEGTFALALDADKRQVQSVTSNPGHCLYCGIADDAKGKLVAERLMAEDMFSGWGVRTLSTQSPAFNPLSYHNGSVWPHDNAIIAAGLKRYGFGRGTERIVRALFDAALVSRESRLPELFCGFRRRPGIPYVSYPVACRPQAWSAAAPFMILQALLGISARAHEGVLTINQPDLPEWLSRIELRNVRIGEGSVSMAFTRSEGTTAVSLLERHGDVRVSIHQE
jgi:glycogen debranching enzyme